MINELNYIKFDVPTVDFYRDGELLFKNVNETELLNLLIQIAEQDMDGCEIKFYGVRHEISSDGKVIDNPFLYDKKMELATKLAKIRYEKHKKNGNY